MVFGELIRSMARRNPDGTAIIFEGNTFTWKEANERINRFGNALPALGLKKGDKVAILAQNSHRYAETLFALAKTGMVAVPISWQSAPPEVLYILNDAEAKAVIMDAEYLSVIEPILSQLTTVSHVIRMGEGGPTGLDYESLVREGSSEEPPVEVFPDDLRALGYTSGTTGNPKGCIITHRQMLACYANYLIEIPVPREQPALMAVPFHTGYGAFSCLGAPYSRSSMVILRRFQPAQVLEAIEKYKIAHMWVVPTMLNALCDFPDVEKYDLSSLRFIGYGGSVIAPTLLKRAMSTFKCSFCQFFGILEAGGFVAFLKPEDHVLDGSEIKERRLLSTGREAQFAEIRLVNDNGNEVPPNEHGELIVRSESTFSGYWKMPEKTAETIRNGWLYTGDVAYRDEDGYIFIADRKKEMIVSGGMNIYPAEIETVLCAHPAVAQAAVIGVPDDRWGEAVKAVVVLKKGAQATAEEIIDFCREHLASYKKPKSVDFVDSLPIASGGKVAKRELRERYWKGRDRRV